MPSRFQIAEKSAGTQEDWANGRRWFERGRDAWDKLGESPDQRPIEAEVARLNSKLAEWDRQLIAGFFALLQLRSNGFADGSEFRVIVKLDGASRRGDAQPFPQSGKVGRNGGVLHLFV